MGGFRKSFLVLQVWLTAFLTLAGEIPHYQCRCPNGSLKPFCLGWFSADGCCCGTNCPGSGCAGTPAARPTKCRSCCHQATPGDSTKSPVGPHLQGPGCTKTVVYLPVFVSPSPPDRSHFDCAALLFPDEYVLSGFASKAGASACLPPPSLPPPDLVTVLQRFLI
jgi:hypothetical protein